MRLLLDECVDWRLLRDLGEYDAKTVKQVGWEKVKNGALLRLAATQFDVFLTVDGNLPYQQNAASLSRLQSWCSEDERRGFPISGCCFRRFMPR